MKKKYPLNVQLPAQPFEKFERPRTPLLHRWQFCAAIITAAVFFACISFYGWLKFNEKKDYEAAIEHCEKYVTFHAKYPGGVSFPEEIELGTSASITDSTRVYVGFGAVDFPNGWGTPVRHYYSCNITVKNGEIEDESVEVLSR
ncbi:hypothetical protein [Corynebacterium sp. HMSC072A02]|uniref:hypothetical protein n=1 Tax=Corynebacterium sp. HMSC072A02 TaxID=1715177 RepID=UPI00143A8EAC|nr:hypothetical protein [Corynebacterium sp. HMSC072A02]